MWLAIINNPFTRIAAGIAVLALMAILLIAFGGSRERTLQVVRTLKDDKRTNRRIDSADISSGDVDADTKWLSGRAKK